MLNLFAFRAIQQKDMFNVLNPIGLQNEVAYAREYTR